MESSVGRFETKTHPQCNGDKTSCSVQMINTMPSCRGDQTCRAIVPMYQWSRTTVGRASADLVHVPMRGVWGHESDSLMEFTRVGSEVHGDSQFRAFYKITWL
ncbi:hypothetical protein TNCV_1960681 [Trichonephila clavipes]|nr:hypothetical protein TNCV_1960681 [Trichonephila clavipes]